jgi:hypothetical protein
MKRFKRALITGASKGLGKEIVQQISHRCENLVLSGRDAASLTAFQKVLREQKGFQGEIDIVVADLSKPDGFERLKEFSKHVDLVINNAGLGYMNRFAELKESELEEMIMVNNYSLTLLTHCFAKKMLKSHGGQIINISSAVAFFPVPYFSTYAATKSYVYSFSKALDIELKSQGVRVKVLCPGGIRTKFHITAGMNDQIIENYGKMIAEPEWVAEAVDSLIESERGSLVPGFSNKALKVMARIFSTSQVAASAGRLYKKFLPQ